MNPINIENKQKALSFLSITAFVGLIALYVFEFRWFQNTFEVKKLILIFGLLGVFLGIVLGYRFTREMKDVVDKIRIYMLGIFIGGIFMPLFGSLSNRLLSFHPIDSQVFELLAQKPFSKERFGLLKGEEIVPDGFYTFIIYEDKPFRIESKTQLFPDKKRGELVMVSIRKGLFGFEVIYAK